LLLLAVLLMLGGCSGSAENSASLAESPGIPSAPVSPVAPASSTSISPAPLTSSFAIPSTTNPAGSSTSGVPSLSVAGIAFPNTEYTYNIINSFPHDAEAFTQGLVYKDGFLYESTGLKGKSSLRKVEIKTGIPLQKFDLAPEYFGEGISIFDKRIYMLTWQNKKGFIYDLEDFKLLDSFSYNTEGWGLTNDGENLVMSDGTSTLYYLDPASLKISKTLQVKDDQGPVKKLNELEYIQGMIFANVWMTDYIVIIDPLTGLVLSRLDLAGLKPQGNKNTNVLNGIAWDEEQNRLFVTGKLWPQLFEIKMVPAADG